MLKPRLAASRASCSGSFQLYDWSARSSETSVLVSPISALAASPSSRKIPRPVRSIVGANASPSGYGELVKVLGLVLLSMAPFGAEGPPPGTTLFIFDDRLTDSPGRRVRGTQTLSHFQAL
jgi:hypothetical protein